MTSTPTPADRFAQALHAYRSADPVGAQAILQEEVAAGRPLDAKGEWLLIQCARASDDVDTEIAALARLLAHAPRDLPALLGMGEARARMGDDRAALSWFTTAIRQAAIITVPPQLHAALTRAQQFCVDAQARFAAHLQGVIDGLNVPRHGSAALNHGVDVLLGRAQFYLQQPTMFYYPGLPQRCFYEREELGWVAEMEAQAPALLGEFTSLLADGEYFAPYARTSDSRPAPNNPLVDSADWGAAYLWQDGQINAALERHVPQTLAALNGAPIPHIPNRSPMALYSRLRPGTHIQPHHGMLNTRLICHLPLVAPPDCALRVGHDVRAWRFGEMLIFDDSVEHEAWNRGADDRTVILFEIWRPEIGDADRALLTEIFSAIDAVDPQTDQGANI